MFLLFVMDEVRVARFWEQADGYFGKTDKMIRPESGTYLRVVVANGAGFHHPDGVVRFQEKGAQVRSHCCQQ